MRGSAWLLALAVPTLASCDAEAQRRGPDLSTGSLAAKVAKAAAQRGEAPSLVYDCDIWHPRNNTIEAYAARDYERLTVRGPRYTFALAEGAPAAGELRTDAGRKLSWTGDLGLVDDPPRRITSARLTTYDDVVNLVWDFEPPRGPGGHHQVICRGTVGGRR